MFKWLRERLGSRNKEEEPKPASSKLPTANSITSRRQRRSARELLKEATQLKKEKRFDEACNKLKEAYSAEDAGDLMVKERLRLPMYLQLAGKDDEGWGILNEMNVKYTDVFSQAEIANQIRIFLQKEKKDRQAIVFGVWTICKEVERDRSNIEECTKMTDEMAQLTSEYGFLNEFEDKQEVVATTSKGNPITDNAYDMFTERIENSISRDGVKQQLIPLLKKAKLESKVDKLTASISSYLRAEQMYGFRKVRDLVSEIINEQ